MPGEAPALAGLQRWMLSVVSHPDGAQAGLEAAAEAGEAPDGTTRPDQVVPGNDRLDTTEQLEIYAFMYFARLAEILEAEYPTLRFLLGPERFDELARSYLVAHPSTHYNLGQLSARFPAFVEHEAEGLPHQAFAVDLARVERAMEDVAEAAADEPLASEELTGIAPDRWASARLQPIRAMQLLELNHPVSNFMNAVREERYASVPGAEPSHLCVHRSGNTVYRNPIEPMRYQLLCRLAAGDRLGVATLALAEVEGGDVSVLVASLGAWFEDWAEDRLFCSVDFED